MEDDKRKENKELNREEEEELNMADEDHHMTTVDWKGRPSHSLNHGGMKAAVFVLGLQTFEIMGIAAVGNNLITYVINEMHFPLSKSANIVTNFIGTIFILALLGGYLSDSYLGCFWTMLIFGFIELSGFILLSVQAHLPQLKPAKCNMINGDNIICEEAKGLKALTFFVALYLVALGSGCVKPNMIAHGADQFNKDDNHGSNQSKKLSSYFNAAYFAFSVGELVALTLLVWVQTHSGMDIGFGLSAITMAMGLVCLVCGTLVYRNKPPQGSILTPIAQVIVAAFLKRKQVYPSNPQMLHGSQNKTLSLHTQRFRFLYKACIRTSRVDNNESAWKLCTMAQVEQVKILLSVIPIFACTIVFNTILAQLQTFSVQQGSSMNTQITKSFHIPPASLQSIPYIILIVLVPLYDTFFVPFARKFTGHDSGIKPLNRIGIGLFVVVFSMVSAALMENKRKNAALHDGEIISIFWITPQFLIFGISEMFTAVGLIEFFYNQSLKGMQSFLTGLTYCSYAFGFFLSSVLVSLVNKVTSSSSGGGWLSNNDLNKDRLDMFYWLLAVLSLLNFFNYLFWARWYSRNLCGSASSEFGFENIMGNNNTNNHLNPSKCDGDHDIINAHIP
ncbi:protein NRT1/ PTR FAMILY 4.3-like [Impatiens glandulifera]|uniref:protein NRT1/ PTR FAMILY 4.3-like n=1 Tax=Impatiens glandulifera TaxID=253017 RepID=UPI001FB06B43|nr:protein NRT1/ PTR FAMILY 4.3-like [Impatiens glandulifera]